MGGGDGDLRNRKPMISSSLPRISEFESDNGGLVDETKVGNSSADSFIFTPFASWNDSAYFAENSDIKRVIDIDQKLLLNNSEVQIILIIIIHSIVVCFTTFNNGA